MENIRIEVEEEKSYWRRVLGGIFVGFIKGCIFWAVFAFASRQLFPLKFAPYIIFGYLIFIAIHFLDYDKQYAVFITLLEITDGNLYINYTKRGKSKTLSGKIEDYLIEYGQSGGRGSTIRTYYIDIFYKGRTKIMRSSSAWNWKDPFIMLTEYLLRNSLLRKTSLKPIELPKK